MPRLLRGNIASAAQAPDGQDTHRSANPRAAMHIIGRSELAGITQLRT